MWRSKTLERTGRREIGWLFDGSEWSPFFGMGATKDDFQSVGSFPLAIDMLNSLVMAGAMLYEVDFNILADIPSGPFDLETSREPNINSTSSSV